MLLKSLTGTAFTHLFDFLDSFPINDHRCASSIMLPTSEARPLGAFVNTTRTC